jgi:PAS domain S-box-containing protein
MILMHSAIAKRWLIMENSVACASMCYRGLASCFLCFSHIARDTEEVKKQRNEEKTEGERILQFETGALSKEELEAVLDSLPVDISFVDGEDRVKYFNKAEGRIFVRTKTVIGRKVQLCHPQKSVHVVDNILKSFKTGRKDVAEFWIQMNKRLIHIRYFAVRDKDKKYLGTLEVTQDITDIKKIEGQRRLLNWKT